MVRKLKKKTTVIKSNLVKMKDFDYVINFGDNTPLLIERYYKGLDLLEENNYLEAEGIFKSIVSQVWGHFDSLVSLIDLYLERDDQANIGKSFNLGIKHTKFLLDQLPEGGKLPWDYSSNKGFLKFLYKSGIRYMNLWKFDEAEKTFRLMLNLDPGDNQDVTEVLIEVLFEMEEFDKIIALTEKYENFKNPSTIFNRILALYSINETNKAKELIKELKEENIKIFNLLDEQLEKEKTLTEYIPYSALEDKSQFYWNNFFRYWDNENGALAFLENHIVQGNIKTTEKPKLNVINEIKKSMISEKLKEVTITGHLNNLESFKEELETVDKVIEKLEKEVKNYTKTVFTKTITSLNKFYTFSVDNKNKLRNIKLKLKELKDKHIINF